MDSNERDQQDTCTCPWTDPETWTTYGGATEPGSTREFDPECPEHAHPAPDVLWAMCRSASPGLRASEAMATLVSENARLADEANRCRSAAEAYWDAVAAFTTERNRGPLSTTLGWSIRHGEIGEALRTVQDRSVPNG